MPPSNFDWKAASSGLFDVFVDGIKEHVDTSIVEVQAKLKALADEGVVYLQLRMAGDPIADRMMAVLTSTARLIGARHAVAAQSKAERIAGQVVERGLSVLATFLRGVLMG